MWVHWMMEMAGLIGSTYRRYRDAYISDIYQEWQVYCGMDVLTDNLNMAIFAECFLRIQKQIDRTTAILRTMSAFTIHWLD
jgi:hypothetical protein